MIKVEIKDLIHSIPAGKKREYLRGTYINGITNYYSEFIEDELDYDKLVEKDFKTILHSKNELVKHLKLFSKEKLDQILSTFELNSLTNKKIIECLAKYFHLELETDRVETTFLEKESNCDYTLHDFQERIRRKVINLMFSKNEKKFLIHMPTGSGKTRTATEIIIDFIRFNSAASLLNEKLKIIWVAQSAELCEQAFRTVQSLYNIKGTVNLHFGNYYGENDLDEEIVNHPAIIFTSIQKLLQNYQSDMWSRIRDDNYLVVVDEAHRSIASEWVKALDFFVENNSVNLIGLTATPGSGSADNSSTNILSYYYNNNKISLLDEKYSEIEKPISYLVKENFLAELDRQDIKSDTVISDGVSTDNYGKIKFENSTLNQLSEDAKRNKSIINIIENHINKNHKILVFTCGIDHNLILKNILNLSGINAEVIDSNSKNRASIIHDFKTGKLNVLLNYGVLTTGFDAPKTNVCIIARPVESIVMYSQMVGRILRGPRNGKGNKKNTLYTIKDNLNHGDYDDLFNSFNDYWN
ncbi:MAG: DEAD/DEAH box helicase [Psychroflexus halocasei]